MAQQFSPFGKEENDFFDWHPAPHSLLDIWNQLAFLWPTQINNLLGSRPVFQAHVQQATETPKELKRLQPLYHRTTKTSYTYQNPENSS